MEIKILLGEKKKVSADIGGIIVHTDQPVQAGGDGSAPSPFALFLASLGTCAGFYIKSFCDSRGIPTDGMHITQKIIYNEQRKISDVIINVELPAHFPEKYIDAVVASANHCAVKQYLENPFKVTTIAKRKEV